MKSSAARKLQEPRQGTPPSPEHPADRAAPLRVLDAADRVWGGEDFGLEWSAEVEQQADAVAASSAVALWTWGVFAAALFTSIALFFV